MIVRAILLVLASTLAANASEMISGKAHVVDGDTLEIGGTKVRHGTKKDGKAVRLAHPSLQPFNLFREPAPLLRQIGIHQPRL
jgi:hypothetical protein